MASAATWAFPLAAALATACKHSRRKSGVRKGRRIWKHTVQAPNKPCTMPLLLHPQAWSSSVVQVMLPVSKMPCMSLQASSSTRCTAPDQQGTALFWCLATACMASRAAAMGQARIILSPLPHHHRSSGHHRWLGLVQWRKRNPHQ